MPAISFSVFKDKILSGEKTQTIRKLRKNPIKVGDRLHLYWHQRSPDGVLLFKTICTEIISVRIEQHIIWLNDETPLTDLGRDSFAIADGFDNWEHMRDCFENIYGLPLEGVLIKWEPKHKGAIA